MGTSRIERSGASFRSEVSSITRVANSFYTLIAKYGLGYSVPLDTLRELGGDQDALNHALSCASGMASSLIHAIELYPDEHPIRQELTYLLKDCQNAQHFGIEALYPKSRSPMDMD